MIEVIGVDVRHEPNRGVVEKERPIGLVRFDDKKVIDTGRGADAQRLDNSPINKTGVCPERPKRRDDHAG